MKTRIILIGIVAVAAGFGITLVSGFYEQTLFPANLYSGTTRTCGGFPFGWWGYSQVGHVFYFPPHWFSIFSFLLDAVFWFLISSALAFATVRLIKMKEKRQIHTTVIQKSS